MLVRVLLAAVSPGSGVGGISSVMGGSDGEIYAKHAEELIRFATALVGPADAPDVLAEAVLGALRSRGWPTIENKRAYLYRSVLNRANAWRRSERRRLVRESRWMHNSDLYLVGDPELPNPEIMTALTRLSPAQRAAIFLTYWEDLDPAAVGLRLGTSEGSVRRQLARARKKLRGLLAHD